MRFDERRYDGAIFVGTNRTRGIWANQVQTLGARVIRNGGRINSSASAHTLLSVALLSALRGVSNATIAHLLSKRRDGRTRVALLVKSIDPSFLPALMALNARKTPTLRAVKSLHRPLAVQMARFNLTLETERENNAILAAIKWSRYAPARTPI